ncbi:PREDICTED: matrix metalloproteinase-2-like [Priapulus caudatus]|uniref:Matrix metalloproteinase-2-like n=1 Tax=Priapulus caudatus TaxID=37621 RepID=A0ABM1E495_PRICU|nr:PREDICTED: matrix metalloproteinase-2-like [Priapulus caudatus]
MTLPRSACDLCVMTLLTCAACLCATSAAAISGWSSRKSDDASAPVSDATQGFLMQFGYLPEATVETGSQLTDEQISLAVKTMQEYAGLPPTGVVDNATRALMARPRCGNKDTTALSRLRRRGGGRRRRYVHQGSRWHKTDLTYKVVAYTAHVHPVEVENIVYRALKLWQDVSSLRFYPAHPSGDADIRVSFARGYHGDGYSFDGASGVLAHAFFPGPDRGGDAHFDEDEQWSKDGGTGVNLFAVAAHEFGHSLGMEHSNDVNALMFPYYQGAEHLMQLPYDDMLGITQLYGYKDSRSQPPPPTASRPQTPYYPAATPSRPQTPSPPPQHPYDPRKPTKPREPYHPRRPQPTRRPAPTLPTTRVTSPREPTAAVIPTTTTAGPTMIDACPTDYDAISVIRGELFIFRGRHFSRLREPRHVFESYPADVRYMWHALTPRDFTRVDAVYQRPDESIVIFEGPRYWIFDGVDVVSGYPQPLSDLGLPADLPRVDAAMVWGYNKKTYLFSGTMYWRFNEDDHRVEYDYPRDMRLWSGVPYNIDAAFQWTDEKTYFFKRHEYWLFDDTEMAVAEDYPQSAARDWMGCELAWLPETEALAGEADDASSARRHVGGLSLAISLCACARVFS